MPLNIPYSRIAIGLKLMELQNTVRMRLKILLLIGVIIFIQNSSIAQRVINGSITEGDNIPLGFVTVLEEGTSNGTVADIDGRYELTLEQDEGAFLVFSFIGYIGQRVKVTTQTTIDVVMEVGAELLDEIVVVGYGTQKKSDITGSVSTIVVDDARALPSTNVAEMLRGKSAGVQVTLRDPSPGGTSSILIRGRNSILGGNDPLFVVDGVPVDNIDNINVEDVESIEVLKDAAAQAIYGARASNGVILLTTKRGQKGSFKVAYHGYYGQQKLTRNFDLYDGNEWADLRREAFRSDNINGEYEPDDFVFTPLQLEVLESGEFVDWEDEVMQIAKQQNHALSLSGGSESTRLYASFGFFDQDGINPGSAYTRGTARLNIDQRVSDKFTVGANVYLLTDKRDIRSSSLSYITLPPLAKVRDENGELTRYPTGDPGTTNPLWNIRESTNELWANQYQFTVFGEYEFFEGFKYKLNSFISNRSTDGGSYQSSLHSSGFASNGRGQVFSDTRDEYLIENILTYDKTINSDNSFDITFLQSINRRKYNSSITTATGFPNDLLGYNGIESASDILPVERVAWERSLASFMGRIRYNFRDKYLFTVTGRSDGSSVFAPDNKWGFFPSAAFAWKAHREPFLEGVDAINELKFRVSYGSIGNEAISPYQTLGLASTENYIFGGSTAGGYQAGSSLFNPDLKWETSTTFNMGIDFGLFGNVLVGSLEFYNTETRDLLVNRTTPGGTGYSSIISNIGRVRNRGIELGTTVNILRRKDWDWSMTLTFTKNDNEILELFGEVDDEGNLLDDVSRNRFIGHPINVIYQYQYDGIWQTAEEIAGSHMPDAEPGNIRVVDVNGDGLSTPDDRVIIHADPDWYGSISTRLSFKGLELYADFYMVQGAWRTNNYLAGYNEGGTLQGVLNGIKVDYWLPEEPSGDFPRPVRSETPLHIWAAAVEDASYVRLRTLSLAYHFPQKWLKKAKLSDFTIYGTGTNVVTWTDYRSYSPELNAGSYPDGKSFVVGIKISN